MRQRNTIKAIIIVLLISFLWGSHLNANNSVNQSRTIEVVGSAEMSLRPDEIKLNIRLRFSSNEKERTKQEDEFFELLKKNGIAKKDVSNTQYANHKGYWYWDWYYWWNYYWYYNSYYQNYVVPVTSKINPQDLFKDLKKDYVNHVAVVSGEVSNITEYRKKVKIEAIKAAKEKAKYLLAAVDEDLGSVVSIQELTPQQNYNQSNWHPYWGYGFYNQRQNLSVSSSNSIVNSGQSQDEGVQGTDTEKLRYEVKVIFSIK